MKIDRIFSNIVLFHLSAYITGYLHFQNWDQEECNRGIKRSLENYKLMHILEIFLIAK